MRRSHALVGLSILIGLAVSGLSGCTEDKMPVVQPQVTQESARQIPEQTDEMKMRQIAWNGIHENSKDTLTIDWREAEVSVIDGTDVPYPLMRSNLKQENIPPWVVQVIFPTTQDAVLGKIIVYIDPSTQDTIGLAPRK